MFKIYFPKDEYDRINESIAPYRFVAYRNQFYVKVYLKKDDVTVSSREMEFLTSTGLHKVVSAMVIDMKKKIDVYETHERLINMGVLGSLV